jgi:hypothetical protein
MKFMSLVEKIWNEGMQDAKSFRTHERLLKIIAEGATSEPEVDYDGTKWQLKFENGSGGLIFEFSRFSSLVNMANLKDGGPGVMCRATPERVRDAFVWLKHQTPAVAESGS